MNRTENLDYILGILMAEQGVDSGHRPLATLADKQRLMRALMNTRPPWPASEDFLKAQDRELQLQLEEKGIVELDDCLNVSMPDCLSADAHNAQTIKQSNNQAIPLLWQGDITRLRVDAIVNAANSQMLGCWHPLHACIDNCIHSAAGIQLRLECHRLMQGTELPTGQARITAAYNLPCRHVVHTVGPIVQGGRPTPQQERQLADCYRNCLSLAEQGGCRSIAFCCISTGVFGFPNRRAAEIAVRTVAEANSPLHVIFNVFKDQDYDIYRSLLAAH